MPQTEADINALFAEIETIHEENKRLRLDISRLETRLSKLEKTAPAYGTPESKPWLDPKKYKTSGAVTFMKNPEG